MATQDDQRAILDLMSQMGSAGRAEGESTDRFPRTFWPVAEHLRAYDPDVVLVAGPRGAGKTELFRAVIGQGLLGKVAPRVASVRLPPLRDTRWLSGYSSQGTGFPSEPQLRAFLQGQTRSDELFLDLWLAYLIRTLKDDLPPDTLTALLSPQGGDVAQVLAAYRKNVTPALLALDALDARLAEERRFVFVGYDELDTLARNDPETTQLIVRGLVALWAGHSRRWQRLRGKIFLRTDLYERARTAGGADFAKLAANRVEITWSDLNLLGMLVRRLVNSGDALRQYCTTKVEIEDSGELGLFPTIRKADDARTLIERMVGVYMGAGIKKGLAFRWVLDHVRDGRGQALPRPLVCLLEAAADIQKQQNTHPRWPRILEPRALRRALDKVSEEHVGSALDEWPWLASLKDRLKSLREVPWERREIDRYLDRSFGEPWGDGAVRPPADSGRDLVDYLVEVGVFRARADGRIDAPDLFLAGLDLKRKGGVRRK
ncbi:MAG: hypothetical protein ACYCST_21760 [Acidimicrobiales bacterium]